MGVKFSSGLTICMNEEAGHLSKYMKGSFPVPDACSSGDERNELAAAGRAVSPLFCFGAQNTAPWQVGNVQKGVKFSSGLTVCMNEEAGHLSGYMKGSFSVLDA